MVDEDKKPRHRLGADELLEETHVAVGKILNLLQSNGLAAESVEHLTTLAKGVDFMVSYCKYGGLQTNSARGKLKRVVLLPDSDKRLLPWCSLLPSIRHLCGSFKDIIK